MGGLDKELRNVCDAACQHVMTKHRSAFKSSQPCSAALNFSLSLRSFLPSIPPFLPLLYLMQLSPPFFSFSSSSSCQAFVLLCCSDTFLKHVEEKEKGKTEGERTERTRKKKEGRGGIVSEKVRDWSAGHFLFHCCREGESAESIRGRRSQEIKSQQTVTEMEKMRNSERIKASDV